MRRMHGHGSYVVKDPRHRWCVFIILGVLLLNLTEIDQRASASDIDKAKEYQLKAAFLYNFAQYIDWPSDTFTSSEQPLRIGILGNDPFGQILDDMVRGEVIKKHRLLIQRSHKVEDLSSSQILFVSVSEETRMPEILKQLANTPIVTVSESDVFCRLGGVIQFVIEGNRVRFVINQGSAEEHRLKMSSQLLSVGRIYHPDDAKDGR
jgi:hypothetical protein